MREFYNSGNIQCAAHGGINVNGNNNGIEQYGNTFTAKTEHTTKRLTLDEWNILEQFFVDRQLNYRSADECFAACTEILQEIEKKNELSVKNILQKVGKGVLNTLLGMGVAAATRASVMPVIEKIIG